MNKATLEKYSQLRIVWLFLFILCSTIVHGQATLAVSRTAWGGAEPTGWTNSGCTQRTSTFACSGNDGTIFDTNGDSRRIFFTGTPNQLIFKLKSSSMSGASSLLVEESADGTTYTTIGTYGTASGATAIIDCANITINLISTTRYIRWTYTKGTGNCDMDDVNISASITSPTLTVSPASLTGFTYFVGSGPSTPQSYNLSGINLTGFPSNITVTGSTNYEVSSDNVTFGATTSIAYTSATLSATPIYVRLKAGLSAGTYNTELVSNSGGGASDVNVTCSGTVTASTASDIITANGEAATISSIINTSGPLTSTDGKQVWQFTIRDGGASADADNLATIVNAITFSQSGGDAVGTWNTAIQSIDLFDGITHVGSGTITSNQIQFTGLNINVADNTQKTIAVRLTLKCGLGAGNNDGDDFGFQISNGNVTFSAAGSGKAAFAAITTTNGTNVIDIVATQLSFIQQPTTTSLNGTMTPNVTIGATDICGNVDAGFAGSVSITSTGTLFSTPQTGTLTAGVATFNSIVHTATGINYTLNATLTGLTSATSNQFDITTSTSLQPGDIAILAFNTQIGSGEDEISFVSFVDITPGTIIDITDNAFEKCGTANGWGIAEGWIRLVRNTSTLPAGKIVTIHVDISGNASTVAPDANWTCSKPQPTGQGSFNLNAVGEQIFFMTGGVVGGPGASTATSDAGTYSGSFLYGFNTKGNIWTPVCANAAGGGTQNSAKPINFDCFLVWPTTQADMNKYTGPLTDTTQRQWIDRIGNPSNWTGYASLATYNAGPDYVNFNGANLGRDIVVLPGGGSFTDGLWTGSSSTDWFECSNWQSMRLPINTTNVTIDQTAIRDCAVGVTAGTAVCNDLSLSSNSAITRNLSIINSSTLNAGGNVTINKTITAATLSLSVLNSGTFACNNLTITGTSSGAENAQFKNKFNTTSVTINGNLTLNAGAQLDLTNTGNYGIVYLKGNYTNNGLESDFKQTNSVVHFNGTGAQNISTNSFNEIFGNVVVNKTSGELTLNNPTEIETNCNLTSGIINSSATAMLIFLDNATVTNTSNASHIAGPVRKIGDDAFTFPVGKNSNYAPASITAPSLTTDHFTAEYFGTDPQPSYDRSLKDPTLTNISACEYWIIDRTNGTSNVIVDLSWNTPRSCGVGSLPDLMVARWNGAMWKDHGNGGTTGNTTAGTIATSAAVTSFSPFTLASVSLINPLPIELLTFTAKPKNKLVELNWQTATEINNDFFTIEKSATGENFSAIAIVDGAGNSNNILNYTDFDNAPLPGVSYYRLKQTDFDGNYTYSTTVSVNFIANDFMVESIYPNPSQNDLNIQFNTIPSNATINIYNTLGECVLNETSSSISVKINTSSFANGVYFISIRNGETVFQEKFIKQ